MKSKSRNLIVVASYGEKYIDNFLESAGDKYTTVVVKTDLRDYTPKNKAIHSITCPFMGFDTGAYLWTYLNYKVDKYLFLQDSLIPHDKDYADIFFSLMPEFGAVVWSGFPMNIWDSPEQRTNVEYTMGDDFPELGFFGPIFAASREALDALRDRRLLPSFPMHKEQQQGKEREWAIAFKKAGIPVYFVVPYHDREALGNGQLPCFTKIFPMRS